MVYTFLSWVVIGISVLLWGYGFMGLMAKVNRYDRKPLDLVIVSGLCMLTVYAQIFSLFYKVGMLALLGVLLVNLLVVILCRRDIVAWLKWDKLKQYKWHVLTVVVVGVVVCALASGEVTHYDSNLYHAQAIHWMEDYKVVPGLGNLSMRLAYNSSFLCLQALFSFKFLLGQSLHSMNGFVVWFMISYAFCSMKCLKEKKVFISDFLRLAILVYYVKRDTISSPETDIFALVLVAYLFVRWVSLLEDKEAEIAPYAYLSIFAVYALTLKLSAAMVVCLAIMPACRLLAQKKWKDIMLYLASGILVLAPFLIRNIILSGYLIYPYPGIDLFSVDWKMPAENALADRNEIKSWGMGKVPVDTPFLEWFPTWERSLSLLMRVSFWASVVSIIALLIIGLAQVIRKKEWGYFHVTISMLACVLLWFFGAPLPRYGSLYLRMIPLYLAGTIGSYLSEIMLKRWNHEKQKRFGGGYRAAMVFLAACLTGPVMARGVRMAPAYLVKCADYDRFECQEKKLDWLTLYAPAYRDLTGYHAFPSGHLDERLRLRGNTVEEGFYWQQEF